MSSTARQSLRNVFFIIYALQAIEQGINVCMEMASRERSIAGFKLLVAFTSLKTRMAGPILMIFRTNQVCNLD